uniref:Secreted protein n=1 Tax=Macrostomum lignano TaxID=282301 RepID=A0A1I8GYG6_9PLAT
MNFQSTLSLELYAGMEVCFKLMVKSMSTRPLLQTLLLRFSKALWSMVLQTMMLTRHRRNPQASRHLLQMVKQKIATETNLSVLYKPKLPTVTAAQQLCLG